MGANANDTGSLARDPERVAFRQRRMPRRSFIMRMRVGYITPLLGAAAAAAAIAVAPLAAAAPGSAPAPTQQNCASSGPGTVCQSPGNVQLNDSPPPVQFYPYGGEALLL
jgi:hypothetical protein